VDKKVKVDVVLQSWTTKVCATFRSVHLLYAMLYYACRQGYLAFLNEKM
jgi:hypothetical protein